MDRLHEELKVALPTTALHSRRFEAGDAKASAVNGVNVFSCCEV